MTLKLDKVDQNVSELKKNCADISAQLHDVRLTTSKLIQQTNTLQEKKTTLESQAHLVEAFLGRFQLSEADLNALETDEIDGAFFKSLQRIVQIRQDCKTLLQPSHQRVGLDIMDSLAERLERVYERLYRWVQKSSQHIANQPEVDPIFFSAFNLLKQMPLYFNHCCVELCQSRRLLLIRRFLAALTQGGPNGVPRPIDYQAGDPQRYVTDIFGWMHQAVASEREFVQALFIPSDESHTHNLSPGPQSALQLTDSDPQPDQNQEKVLSDTEHAQNMLSSIFEGLNRPLKVRIEQAITSRPGLIVSFKLWNVTQYYSQNMRIFFPASSTVTITLDALQQASKKVVFDLLDKQAKSFRHSTTPYSHDLSPPRAIMDLVQQMRELLQLNAQSLVLTSQEHMESNFASVLSSIIDPILEVEDVY